MTFPHPLTCVDDGLLAYGGDLSESRLLLAYRFGIFPWYNESPILWWFLHPRCVLYPEDLRIHKSMRSYLNQDRFRVTYNQCFTRVMATCAEINRPNQDGTWINEEMTTAYTHLHDRGLAHSIEVWQDDSLVGGLYGLYLGKIFFGESMFSNVSNASKYGFIHLVRKLKQSGCRLIDCQQDTPHMKTLGATMISKEQFWRHIKSNLLEDDINPF